MNINKLSECITTPSPTQLSTKYEAERNIIVSNEKRVQ